MPAFSVIVQVKGMRYEENSGKFLKNKSNKEKNNEIYQQQFNC